MSIGRKCRTVIKRHKELSENYRVVAFSAHISKKKFQKADKALILKMKSLLKTAPSALSEKDIFAYFDACFSEIEPEEELLFSSQDDLVCSSLLLLDDAKDESEKARYLTLTVTIVGILDSFDFEEFYISHSAVSKILTRRNFLEYAQCDDESKAYIRRLVNDYAKEHGISEKEAAKLIKENYIEKITARKKRIYLPLIGILTLLFLLAVLIFCGFFDMLLLVFPLFTLAGELVGIIASFTQSPAPILKIKTSEIEKNTAVVISALLTSEKDAEHFGERLEKMYLQNKEEHLIFGLLADYKDAPHAVMPEDRKIADAAEKEIRALNEKYGERFFLFLRPRKKSQTEKNYMGWERKRGAIIEFCRFLSGKGGDFEKAIINGHYINNTSYILTLDADTDLRIGAVKKLYSAMIHPYNKPVIKNGVVVSGYGVIEPRLTGTAFSSAKSPFSMLYAGGGGIDSYENAIFDFYQSIFGKGAFGGKGMIDLDAFDKVIDNAFPDGRILSHDLLEGTRLRCGYMSELCLADCAPSTALSFFKRQHRWSRGDLQSFPFALCNLPFEKEKKKNPIDGISKYMILSNVSRVLTPLFAFLALAFSTLLDEAHCALFLLFSFSYLLVPLLLTVLRTAKYVGRRFYSAVLQNVWKGIGAALYALCSLAYNAQLSLDALIRVLYRSLISGKKLLEWVTAGESEKKYKNTGARALFTYIKQSLPSLAASLLLLIFSEGGVVRLLAISFLLFPVVSLLLSKPYKTKKHTGEKEIEKLTEYAETSFGYFKRFVTAADHFLPPDNYEEFPSAVLARRTSPTNIGLYMLSVACMKELGKIDENEAIERLENTLQTIEELPKCRGHLYNWYNTETLEILGNPCVSTVDSGNFVLSLLCVSELLTEYRHKNAQSVKQRIDVLTDSSDFSFLYNPKKKMLCVCYDTLFEKQSENCYDLLLSEARSAYYFAIAKGQIPQESWGRIARPVTVKDGHVGILSWSGTAFEYFMPTLFLPVYENTLLYEALCFALFEQTRDRTKKLWGRSESCYYAFDRMLNYQYKAFGCSALALDPSVATQNVIAPYASFLFLCLSPKAALDNLRHLEEAGAYGAFGFYESLDFTKSRVGRGCAVIKAYMSHHLGMSIIAATNICKNNVTVNALMKNKEMQAAKELLSESVPADVPTAKTIKRREQTSSRIFIPGIVNQTKDPPDHALIYKDGMRILASGNGKIALASQNICISPPLCAERSYKEGMSFCLKTDKTSFLINGEHESFSFDGREIVYSSPSYNNAKLRMLTGNGGIAVFKIETQGKENESTLLCTLPLALANKEEYVAHPAFCGLSVESEYLSDAHILLFHKRKSSENGQSAYLGVFFSDRKDFEYLSSASEIEDGRIKDLLQDLFDRRLSCKTGAVRKPFLAVKKRFLGNTELIFCFAKSKQEICMLAEKIRRETNKKGLYNRLLYESILPQKKYSLGVMPDRETIPYISLLLSGIVRRRNPNLVIKQNEISALWQYGISGDHPIFTFELSENPFSSIEKRLISGIIRAHSYLCFAGINCDLVFIRKNNDGYFSQLQKETEELVRNNAGDAMLDRDAGIRLLTDERTKEVLPSFSRIYLPIDRSTIFESLKKQFFSSLEEEEPQTADIPSVEPSNAEIEVNEKEILVKRRKKMIPMSYIYCGRQFGTLLTDRSLGFTYFRNSGEFRLTPYSGEEREDHEGEKLILSCFNKNYDLCLCADQTRYTSGYAVYSGNIEGIKYSLYVGVDLKLPVKELCLELENKSDKEIVFSVNYRILPSLHKSADGNVTKKHLDDAVIFKRTALDNTPPFALFLVPEKTDGTLLPNEKKQTVFLLGTCHVRNDKEYYYVREHLKTPADVFSSFRKYADYYDSFTGIFRLSDTQKEFSLSVNRYIPLQALTSRLFARTGFYQPGGAYGFRDQLQDALCMLPYDEKLLERQIYRCASHQYEEGDVQHWWHRVTVRENVGDFGVRTHCSDDLLFLPYACAEYVLTTGNVGVLDKKVRYISSAPLSDGKDRCEIPKRSERKESIYFHCLRAIERTETLRGKSGLCSMGSCDWNDGYSEVGGESVWLTQFFLLVLRKFLLIAKESDKETLLRMIGECEQALLSVYDKGQYLRAIGKNRDVLGKEGNDFCEIDLLPQAFSVFLDKDSQKAKKAIEKAYNRLYDDTHRLLCLFYPPYDKKGTFPGYLAAYCPGFRENGGQYTHAAIWGAMALILAGEREKGSELLLYLDPQKRATTDKAYKIEPYAIAGDVYSAKGFEGRGGWSLYTGAAGWYLCAVWECLIGYKEVPGGFILHPTLSKAFDGFSLTVQKKSSIYRIKVSLGTSEEILLDGEKHKGIFPYDGKEHFVKMVLQNDKRGCIM